MSNLLHTSITRCPICSSNDIIFGKKNRAEIAPNQKEFINFYFRDSFCNSCGFTFSSSRPSEKLLEKYYSYYLENLTNISEEEIRRRIELILRLKPPGSKILELGGGESKLSSELLKLGYSYDSFEPSQDKEGLRLINNTSKNYDIICSYFVAEHVLDLHSWMKDQRLKLKIDGYIILEVPDFKNFPLESLNNEHINHFTKESLDSLLLFNGFKPIDTPTISSRFFGVTRIGKRYQDCNQTQTAILPGKDLINGALRDYKKSLDLLDKKKKLLDDLAIKIAANIKHKKVGLWAVNEISTCLIKSIISLNSSPSDLGNLQLFDKGQSKIKRQWLHPRLTIQAPDAALLNECSVLYCFSPSHNIQIKNIAIEMGFNSKEIHPIDLSKELIT